MTPDLVIATIEAGVIVPAVATRILDAPGGDDTMQPDGDPSRTHRGGPGRALRRLLAVAPLLLASARPAAGEDQGGAVTDAPPIAVARVEGTISPGLRATLCACDSTGADLTYRWVQVGGPTVALDDPSGPDAGFAVPAVEGTLEFLLVVANGRGIDTEAIPVEVAPSPASRGPAGLVADAGDDQIGRVGRQVTLNGIRSRPEGVGFRWIQVDGPPVSLAFQDGYIFAFVPTAPGIHRFALVVAEGGQISEPSFVDVAVEPPPPGESVAPREAPDARPTAAPPVPIDELARSALRTVPGGEGAGVALADCFEAIAGKMDLYESYDDVQREVAMRLVAILPDDDRDRARWAGRVFEPLTLAMVQALRPIGLDLSSPGGRANPLGDEQRRALAEQFRAIARGFRGAPAAR